MPRSVPAKPANAVIDTIDAVYDVDVDEATWLRQICRAAAPAFERGRGLVAYSFDARKPERFRVGAPVCVGPSESYAKGVLELGHSLSPEQVEQAYRRPFLVACQSDAFDPALFADSPVARFLGTLGITDQVALQCLQPDGTGHLMVAGAGQRVRLSRAFVDRWSRVAMHFAAGARLRRRLRRGTKERAAPDAVFRNDGRAELLDGPAALERADLTQAVRARELARSRSHRGDPDAATALWQALVAGRWTLVDQVDRDGKRYILARRNAPRSGFRAPTLTLRERQVGAFFAQGYSNKLIGYALGLSTSTVATHLEKAARKLGVAGASELSSRILALTANDGVALPS